MASSCLGRHRSRPMATTNRRGYAASPEASVGGPSGQLIGVAGNLLLTPFIIHGLGIQRYGIFVLVVTLSGMLTTFDGGAMSSAARYFSVYAGTDDRKSTTRLLVTFCLILTALGIVMSAAAWFLSPVVVGFSPYVGNLAAAGHLLVPDIGHPGNDTVHPHSVPTGTYRPPALGLEHVYRHSHLRSVCLGFVIVINAGAGLRGVAFIFIGQQVLASVLVIPVAMRYLDRRGIGLATVARAAFYPQLFGQDADERRRVPGRHRSRLAGNRRRSLGGGARYLFSRGQFRQPTFVSGLERPRPRRRAPRQHVRTRGRSRAPSASTDGCKRCG